MSVGDSAWNSGLKPLKRTVRSRAGLVRSTGMVAWSGSRAGVADLLGERDVALPDEVAVLDGGERAAGDRGVLVDGEAHQGAGAVDDLDVLDDPDLDPGHPDVVALDHAGGVDELRLVGAGGTEGEVADGDDEDGGGQRGDEDEDHQLGEVERGAGVEERHQRASPSVTVAPRAMGPTSSTPRSGTSAAVVPMAVPAAP